jgi:hypothetical protein
VVRDERGVEAGPGMPPEVGIEVEILHQGAVDVMRGVGMAVKVNHSLTGRRARQ